MLEATVLNNRDVALLPGERVRLYIPTLPFLPIEVLSMEGVSMGYLGRNNKTCAVGTATNKEIYDLLQEEELEEAIVTEQIYCHTKERKVIIQIKTKRSVSFA